MDKYINKVSEPYSKYLYEPLIKKEADRPLVEYIVEAWESLNNFPGMEFVGYEYTEKESEIETNKYLQRRKRPTSSTKRPPKNILKNTTAVKAIDPSRMGLLTVYIGVTAKEKGSIVHKVFEKSMFIPIEDEYGRIYSNGKYFNIVWQLLEKSTYTYQNQLVFKSSMLISIYFNRYTLTDINVYTYKTPIYKVDVRKEQQYVMLMFAVWCNGINGALAYLGLSGCIDIIRQKEVDLESEEYLYFKISSDCYVRVIKMMFEKYIYIQSVVSGIMAITNNRTTCETCSSDHQFLLMLGGGKLENGINYRQAFFRGINITVQKESLLPDCSKNDIYTLIRWLVENYQELRQKENPNYANKRLRRNEQLGSIFGEFLSQRAMKLMTGNGCKELDEYKNFLKFQSDILFKKLSSPFIQFDAEFNDMSFWTTLKFSNKGHQSPGIGNSKRMSREVVATDISHIGRKDLTSLSNTEPGVTGLLSPFNQLNGLYFDDTPDPDGFGVAFYQDMKAYMEKHHRFYIAPETSEEKILHEFRKRSLNYTNQTSVNCTSINHQEVKNGGMESLDKGFE